MTAVIVIREASAGGDGSFGARVDFGDGGGADVVVTNPADSAQEALLAWYFEERLRYPLLDKDLEGDAVELIAGYGQALFHQAFSGEAYVGYRRARDRGFDGCRVVVQGSAAFHRLHWETLRDPDGGVLLALRMPFTRRVAGTPLQFELPDNRQTLNLLVVTARPDGPKDVGYRTISRPLLDAVRQARLPVTVDIVRPGTWEALQQKLRAASREHGTGWYQVVHLDVHGAFETPAALGGGAGGRRRYLFEPGRLAPDKEQGFVFFETASLGQTKPVPAAEVAALLAEHRVAVAVLNACQSAMQSGNEASLAQELVAAGAPVAVGMAYSVTVSAAEQAMPVLYRQLVDGDDPSTATWVMRQALDDHKSRRGYFDQELDLHDWMLPVVFGQRDLSLRLRPMTGAEQEEFYKRQGDIGTEPHVEYGFLGRDLDIHALERQLLMTPDRNQVLVQGMAGAGKSTLLAHVGWWWRRTGLVENVFSFTYEERAWTAGQICRHIASALLAKVEFSQWEVQNDTAKTEQIASMLRATRHLLIIDNAESIAATPAAIPHALSDVERERFAGLLARLRGGRSLVLIGSREAESWLAPNTFGDNTYALPGLDPQAASALLERILTRHGGLRYVNEDADAEQRQALKELMGLLSGFPLPMTVVLPQLATAAPADVLAELRAGGELVDPVGTVRRAIEYSHGKLDPTIQRSMLLLAPFTATIPTAGLDVYAEVLAEHQAVQSLGDIDLRAAVDELTRVGLATRHPALENWAQTVPVLPYFLRSKLSQRTDLGQAIQQAHYRLYYTVLAPEIRQLLNGNEPQERSVGRKAAAAEHANLTAAVDYGLTTGQPILAIIRAIDEYLEQSQQHDSRRTLLEHAITNRRNRATVEQQQELAALHNLAGVTALNQRRLADAQTHHETGLAIKQALGRRETQAITYFQLGRVGQEQAQRERAERHYQQALSLYLEFEDRQGAAMTYHQLGVVALEQGRLEQAEQHYQQALTMLLELGNRYSAATAYHQLGRVAQAQGRLVQAEQHYRQALTIFLEFEDRYHALRTYHQLGRVAQDQGRFEQAERHYRQALTIFLEFGDRYSAASTYGQLGLLVQQQGRLEQAEQYLRLALETFIEFDDQHHIAISYHQLGVVLSLLQRHVEALDLSLRASVLDHRMTGDWPDDTVENIRLLRRHVPAEVFQTLVAQAISADLQDSFQQALDQVEDGMQPDPA